MMFSHFLLLSISNVKQKLKQGWMKTITTFQLFDTSSLLPAGGQLFLNLHHHLASLVCHQSDLVTGRAFK